MANSRRNEDISHPVPLKYPAPMASNSTESAQPSRKPGLAPSSSDREVQLRTELESLREINTTISSILTSLDRAGSNLDTVQKTLGDGIQLVDLYTDILSQSHHTTKLILDPEWGGATKDMDTIEEDARRREDENRLRAYRREQEERQRTEQEDARQSEIIMVEDTSAKVAGRGRGRGRGQTTARGIGRPPSSTSGAATASNRSTGSVQSKDGTTSGRGRGSTATRGRGRGAR